jgi:hypothetical protein
MIRCTSRRANHRGTIQWARPYRRIRHLAIYHQRLGYYRRSRARPVSSGEDCTLLAAFLLDAKRFFPIW